jgi:anti-sigma factor RsiW
LIQESAQELSGEPNHDSVQQHKADLFLQPLMQHRQRLQYFPMIAALMLVSSVLGYGMWRMLTLDGESTGDGPSPFAVMAADTHRRYLQKQLPLEIVSGFPEQISGWFTGKVKFKVELPDYQEESGQVKLYRLEGARLVGFKEDYAAYVAYQMDRQPISLVVTSDAVARPSGGDEIVAQGLTFHFNSIFGFKVITWSDRGLTYALVSDLEERGLQSCIVCHQGTKDRDLIEGLKPKP